MSSVLHKRALAKQLPLHFPLWQVWTLTRRHRKFWFYALLVNCQCKWLMPSGATQNDLRAVRSSHFAVATICASNCASLKTVSMSSLQHREGFSITSIAERLISARSRLSCSMKPMRCSEWVSSTMSTKFFLRRRLVDALHFSQPPCRSGFARSPVNTCRPLSKFPLPLRQRPIPILSNATGL